MKKDVLFVLWLGAIALFLAGAWFVPVDIFRAFGLGVMALGVTFLWLFVDLWWSDEI